jgi:tetratricopeptide (TPR) repeat protein
VIPAGVILVTLAACFPALSNGFVNWDDDRNFLTNPAYRGLGWAQLRWMFTTFHLGPYQPLSWMTLGLDYLVWGMNPRGYHLTSVLLHVANAGLFYALVLRLLGLARAPNRTATTTLPVVSRYLAAGAGALLFAIHPLRAESVAWVTERRDVLSGFFILLTCLCYLKAATRGAADPRRGRRWLAGSVALYALSLLSKATGMTLPVVLLALDYYPLRKFGTGRAGVRRTGLEKIPFVALAIAATITAAVGQSRVGILQPIESQSLPLRAARAGYGMVFYLGKTLLPAGLSNLYEVPFRLELWDAHFLLSGALIVFITAGLIAMRRRWPAALVCWISYAALMLPVSGLGHGGGQILADRYTYLPCLAWAVMAAAGIEAAATRVRPALVAIPVVSAIAALGALTWSQCAVWRSSESLWRHAYTLHPLARLDALGAAQAQEAARYRARLTVLGENSAYWAICYGLGAAVQLDRKFDEAIAFYRRALEVNPRKAELLNNWGVALGELGRDEEAIQRYREAIAVDPRQPKAHGNLAFALDRQGHLDDALAEYRRALEIGPKSAQAYNNLAVVLSRQGKLTEAVAMYREALAIDPGHRDAQRNLDQALRLLGGK